VKKHIVVVDDDTVFGEILSAGLHKNAFTTKRFDTVDAFLKNLGSLSANPVDLFIIDFHLDKPNINGLDLCRRIKSKGAYPVIMLTGEDDVETTVACLYAGAEQYVTKPYELDELVARIHVVLKGWARAAVSYLESSGDAEKLTLTLQGRSRVLSCGDKETKLTQREVSLAESLLGSMGIEMEREHIYFAIFGRAMEPFSRAVDILVARLRKKLKLVTDDYVIIPTRNSGYMLVKK
jgi:two-component system, OmpR family, response regulator